MRCWHFLSGWPVEVSELLISCNDGTNNLYVCADVCNGYMGEENFDQLSLLTHTEQKYYRAEC